MGNIGDISKYQPSKAINWPVYAKQFDLLFIRVQYGSSVADAEYPNHTANAVQHGVDFYSYAFPRFVSIDDARVEARDARKREHANSLGMVIDIETEYDSNGNPSGITKLSQSVRLEGIKAFVAELRAQGVNRVGAYVAHNVYEAWGIASIVDLFDFIWIPRYGATPKYPCDLHQYTDSGRVDGYGGNIDLNVLVGDKSLEWFKGASEAPAPAQPSGGFIMVVKAIGEGDIRDAPSHDAGFIRNTKDGELFNVISIQNDWHQVAVTDSQVGWIDGNNGQNLYWVDNPALKGAAAPASQYYVVKSGDTLGKIAKANGVTIAQIQSLNGIKDVNKIYVGQKLRLK